MSKATTSAEVIAGLELALAQAERKTQALRGARGDRMRAGRHIGPGICAICEALAERGPMTRAQIRECVRAKVPKDSSFKGQMTRAVSYGVIDAVGTGNV